MRVNPRPCRRATPAPRASVARERLTRTRGWRPISYMSIHSASQKRPLRIEKTTTMRSPPFSDRREARVYSRNARAGAADIEVCCSRPAAGPVPRQHRGALLEARGRAGPASTSRCAARGLRQSRSCVNIDVDRSCFTSPGPTAHCAVDVGHRRRRVRAGTDCGDFAQATAALNRRGPGHRVTPRV
jgi:hypothetical protein